MNKEIESFKDMKFGYKTTFGNLTGYTVFRCGSGLFVKLHKEDEYAVSFFGFYKEKFGFSCEVIAITRLRYVFTQRGGMKLDGRDFYSYLEHEQDSLQERKDVCE